MTILGLLPPFATLAMLGLAALLGGLVRGFTGFGFAMVFMPLAGTVVPLPVAYAIIWWLDAPVAAVLATKAAPKAHWREVLPLFLGAALCFPIGLHLLLTLDPTVLRWIVALVIAAAVTALACGWRWHGRPGTPLSLAVGGLSGLANGFASLGGLPIAIFWLSAQAKSALQMRHDLMLFFGGTTILSGCVLWWSGVLSMSGFATALPLIAVYWLGVFIGSRGFHLASERTFRRIAYCVIALSAAVSLPLLDAALGRAPSR